MAKHNYFLARDLAERFPFTQPQNVHRVYRTQREQIRERYGDGVATVVPKDGLIDVHRHLLTELDGRQITLDATFPGAIPGREVVPSIGLRARRGCRFGRQPR